MHIYEAKIASRGYHIFMNTTWTRAYIGENIKVEIETNSESIRRDPYACAIRKTDRFFANVSETVGNIPRELSRHIYHFILYERGTVSGTVVSTQYRPSSIPAGGLEIPLLLRFECPDEGDDDDDDDGDVNDDENSDNYLDTDEIEVIIVEE